MMLNLHGVEFSLRVSGWVETLRAGENIQDTGLFMLLLGVILALCGMWLMWAMIRQRRVLNGLLPIAATAGSQRTSQPPVACRITWSFCFARCC